MIFEKGRLGRPFFMPEQIEALSNRGTIVIP
jgi:hypothetical protein